MLVSGLGILCWVMMRKRLKRRRRTEPAVITSRLGHNANAERRGEQFSGIQSLGAPPEVLKWQVELHDLGRELKAELDTKLIAVRTLTRQYEQAARRLSDLIRMAEQVSPPVSATLDYEKRLPVVKQLRLSGWNDRQIAEALEIPISSVAERA